MPRPKGSRALLPAYAGRAMQAELEALEAALGSPKRPVVAIVGGAKVSTKIDAARAISSPRSMRWSSAAAWPTPSCSPRASTSASRCASTTWPRPRAQIIAEADKAGCTHRPAGRRASSRRNSRPDAPARTVDVDAMPADEMILDVGPKSIAAVDAWLDEAATLVWNGPLGAFETPPFDAATVAVARHAAARTKAGKLVSVAGGGDTVAALNAGRRRRTISPMSRPPAAPSSNGWKARRCRASRR